MKRNVFKATNGIHLTMSELEDFEKGLKNLKYGEKKLAIFHMQLWIDYGKFGNTISEKALKSKIGQFFGSDYRTVRKYYNLLQGYDELHHVKLDGKGKVVWHLDKKKIRIRKFDPHSFTIVNPKKFYNNVWSEKKIIKRIDNIIAHAKERDIDLFEPVSELEAEEEATEKEVEEE